MTRHVALLALTALALAFTAKAGSKRALAPEAVAAPQFLIRARVVSVGGHSPSAQLFTFRWGTQSAKARGGAWSPWLSSTASVPAKRLRVYAARWHVHFPTNFMLQIHPVVDPTRVDVQVRFRKANHPIDLYGDLFGPRLGMMVWPRVNGGTPQIATLAGYNHRYWPAFKATALRLSQRPKHFLIINQFVGGDDDRADWQDGISHVASTGITAMLIQPSAPLRTMLENNGLRRFTLGVGRMPGGLLGVGLLGVDPDAPLLSKWVSGYAGRYLKAGYPPGSFSAMGFADEPGWYVPNALRAADKHPAALEKFRHYLEQHGFTPPMLGETDWDKVYPIGQGKVSASSPLPVRRHFYWSCRFFPWVMAEYLHSATTQLHRAFSTNLKTFSNFNNFGGQFYFEGFPGSKHKPPDPDTAMAGPDWFEFGRLHATDLLWTEDWFGNNRAYQWSFYAAKFRSIAYKNGLGFGGYVVGRVDGEPKDGLIQRVLALVGSGAKVLFEYDFGPNYNFPGNCYSEVPGVVGEFARANRMIAKAEDVLWPGKAPQARVAILQPRSAEIWDGLHTPQGTRVFGRFSTNLNSGNLDYMSEIFDEYLALEMSDVPADFVSEDGLADGTLKNYKVLYITEPDIPVKGQRAIAQWVKNGGTLAMVPGAAQGDRYDEPVTILTSLSGSPWHSRTYVPNVLKLKQTETIGNIPVFGGPPAPAAIGKTVSFFSDKIPAVQQDHVGKGNVIYYTYFPGLSFAHFALNARLELQQGAEADALRRQVLTPVRTADVMSPVKVNTTYVETPVLMSSAGAAITFLNWTGHNLPSVRVTFHAPFRIARAESVTKGRLQFHQQGNRVTFSLPLGSADVVELKP